MLEVGLANGQAPRCVLLLGAHCDDVEIGMGGTVARLSSRFPSARFVWLTLSGDDVREPETRRAAARLLAGVERAEIHVERFRGSYFPQDWAAIKDRVEAVKRDAAPDVVFTHYRDDLHQDHRVVNELTWNAFRDQLVLEYEIPKFDGDHGRPDTYVALDRHEVARKADLLVECFPSQHHRGWFTRETFEAIARLRGIECNAPGGYAEAFYMRKARLAF